MGNVIFENIDTAIKKVWLEDEQASNAKGKVSELYAYWDQDSDETVWSVIDH
ncbi:MULTISPECIES: hypothetical protein [Bacillus]|uniref:hypothetical protein n=1 Tax=Bacillus TaxID=1386 RepID=UPI0013F6124B|nr:hypothetical protein [Bacillus mycoides]